MPGGQRQPGCGFPQGDLLGRLEGSETNIHFVQAPHVNQFAQRHARWVLAQRDTVKTTVHSNHNSWKIGRVKAPDPSGGKRALSRTSPFARAMPRSMAELHCDAKNLDEGLRCAEAGGFESGAR